MHELIRKLKVVLSRMYRFDVEQWQIPFEYSHTALKDRVCRFMVGANPEHLKVIYYFGKVDKDSFGKTLYWKSHENLWGWRASVQWSDIQSTLELSNSDVLLLLESYYPKSRRKEKGSMTPLNLLAMMERSSDMFAGLRVTEVFAAYDSSHERHQDRTGYFTRSLTDALRKLGYSELNPPRSFTTCDLYHAMLAAARSRTASSDGSVKPKPVPLHVILNQDKSQRKGMVLTPKLWSSNSLDENEFWLGTPQPGNPPEFVSQWVETLPANTTSEH